MYAYESADPVEEETFKVDGVEMSDFVYPAYFEDFHEPGSTQFRSFEKIKTPVSDFARRLPDNFCQTASSQTYSPLRRKKNVLRRKTVAVTAVKRVSAANFSALDKNLTRARKHSASACDGRPFATANASRKKARS